MLLDGVCVGTDVWVILRNFKQLSGSAIVEVWEAVLGPFRFALFLFTQGLGGNLGYGIIALSLAVRLSLLPWALRAAERSSVLREKMKNLRPRMEALQKRYAKDPAKLGTELQREYRDAGVNPIRDSGLGIGAIQAIVGIALFSVIRQGLNGVNPFLWIADLARPDRLLALFAAAGTVVALLVHPTNGSGSQIALATGVLLGGVTLVFAWHIASGVALYWTSSAVVGIGQNLLLRRRLISK
jgi:YidC/Oxa1 family membrane protein insertase